ncbi:MULTISPECIES: lysylphosphatidylglycerol synthase transmembrane domain-containing protein [Halocynthiibacter]|uniref:Flippase-like domain-containing protein n=1 Tax=Halocynthiibacter halioticoli TaxID=2986804 RepID=A0AAE3IZL4_9RHOB|nr:MULTISPECIES: lysylphosphatidylglycerol synthase transmembrane domain-containing protein [Halocynthiibacter]MCV6825262.1 flippase-like domain-containing protein [Halocynthiibacter halioticoli]MCW4058263.1 flippase-like domain-containing protein [Halocynthiibacter sp. SDUM655004]
MRTKSDIKTFATTVFTSKWRDPVMFAGLLLLVLIGLIGLAAATGWEETLSHLESLTFWQISLLLLLSLANYGLRGIRWHVFAHRLDLPLSLFQSLRHFFGGFAMSVTPARVGELVRIRWIGRETGASPERTAPLAIVDRASDLSAMAILLAIALVFAAGGPKGAIVVAAFAIIAAIIATNPRIFSACVTRFYRITGVFPRFFVRVRRASQTLAQFSHFPTVAMTLLCGLAGWFAEGYAFFILLQWMGADIGLATCIVIFVFSTLAGGLTGAPGGIGGAEAAMIALLSLEGVPISLSVPATAVIRLTTLWFAIALGLAIFPLAERISKRGPYALEK